MRELILIAVHVALLVLGGVILFSPAWYPFLRAWLNRRITAGIEYGFQRRLEDHKHELSLAAEAARFDYQRRISDFNLYSSARHESYAELWKLIRAAHGRILELARPVAQEFDYFDADDVEKYLIRKGIPSGKRTEVLQVWINDRSAGVAALNAVVASSDAHEAVTAFISVNNQFVARDLYLSDPVSKATGFILGQLDMLRVNLQSPEGKESIKSVVLQHEVYEAVQQLKRSMQDELARGDYVIPPSVRSIGS